MRGAIVVTGATGFVGRMVCRQLVAAGHQVRAVVRREDTGTRSVLAGADLHPLGDLTAAPAWSRTLAGAEAIVHLAARVHIMRESAADAAAAYHTVNVEATQCLLQAASEASVPRVVYLSSIKVNGERTLDRPFSADDLPAPVDHYGRTKLAAEQLVLEWGNSSGRTAVVLRPPLVYGPGAAGNLVRLLRWIDCRVPLPLRSIRNRRTLISLRNLSGAICAGLWVPDAAGTYLLGDNEAISTPDLIRLLGRLLRREAILLPCPPALLRAAASVAGKQAEVERLTESLEVDASRARQRLGWQPTESLEEGLEAMVSAYRQRNR